MTTPPHIKQVIRGNTLIKEGSISFRTSSHVHDIIGDQIEVPTYQQMALLDVFCCTYSSFEEMHLPYVRGIYGDQGIRYIVDSAYKGKYNDPPDL